ncbi:hypothetical protein [Zooshikella ganghwensis]|uniref:YtkA-like domain-containing protein n=1 Tax=Zooshikella ganghwensis TaxID=202772 RepID=A0A4P9VQ95_9GAMM|nr:hypothetical protein [Zooshikella ganghwensis]RDH45695.1 hypothetical protein B9G39_20805 [Zooshikella ganghwensis]
MIIVSKWLTAERTSTSLVVLGLILLAVIILPRWLLKENNAFVSTSSQHCQLTTEPCLLTNSSPVFTHLQVTPTSLPYDKPITFNVKLGQITDQSQATGQNYVTLQLVGKTMNMGLLPIKLKQIAPQQFEGNVILSYCTIDPSMQWQADIRLHTPTGIHQILIDLIPNDDT